MSVNHVRMLGNGEGEAVVHPACLRCYRRIGAIQRALDSRCGENDGRRLKGACLTTLALDRDWGRCYYELSPRTRVFGRVYILDRGLGSVVHG